MCLYSKSVSSRQLSDANIDEDGLWQCPYEVEKNNQCIFHLPLNEKDNREVAKRASQLIAKDEEKPAEIVGGKFGTLKLSEINRDVVLPQSDFNRFEIESGTTVQYKIDMLKTTYGETVNANQVEFKEKVQFGGSTVNGLGKFSFRRSEFHGDVLAQSIECGRFQISRSEFHSRANFGKSDFKKDSRIRGTTFHEQADFGKSSHHGQTEFDGSTFEGRTIFRDAKAQERLTFIDVNFDTDDVIFELAQLEEGLLLKNADLSQSNFERADVRGCEFTKCDFTNSNLKSTDFRDAVLHGSDLRGSEMKGIKLADINVDGNTAFLGDPKDKNPKGRDHSILSLLQTKPCIYDPRADFNEEIRADMTKEEQCNEAKNLYHTIEQAARQSSRPQLLSQAFVYRQDIQKRQYWSDMKNEVEDIERNASERIIAFGRWARAKTARVTLLYGESPWRIVGWSSLIILLFALSFTFGNSIRSSELGPMNLTLSEAVQQPAVFADHFAHALYYSTMTYISFGPLGYEPVQMGKMLVTLESALGAVMIALLVFVFGRRAAR